MSTVPFSRHRQAPLPEPLSKILPSNIDAEKSILGAVLLDNATIRRIDLTADEFFLPQHQKIYLAMMQIAVDEKPIDFITLGEQLTATSNLENAGGLPYISSLVDGVPRVSNVEHYAKIVRDKFRLRALIHLTHKIQTNAFEGEADTDALLQTAETSLKSMVQVTNENPAVVVGFQSLLTRECAPIEYAIDPLLTKRGTGELFSERGFGKSLIATHMAVEIAMGAESLWGGHRGAGGHWAVARPFRQLYVYGEMTDSEIQERIRMFARMRESDTPSDEQLGTMCMDYQKGWRPKLSSAADRKFIENRIFEYGYEGLWLDNLSTLWPSSNEDEGERDAILADWYTDLNQRGIWVMWLHHAGKSGEQRGGSAKEDMLSCVLRLTHPANYKPNEQCRVQVDVKKNRHKCTDPRTLLPFEIMLTKNAMGIPEWVTRPALAAQRAAAFEMFKNGMPTMLVGQEVGVSRATAYRWHKDFQENPAPDFHLESEKE